MRAAALLAALAMGLAAPAAAQTRAQAAAQIDYMLECQGCHLPDGSGSAQGAVPALAGSVGRFLTVPGGRSFLVRVPGSAQSPLDDARLAAVLNWIIRRFGPAEVAASFTPYTADEVGRHRRKPLTDVDGARADLLRRIREASAPPG